MDKYYLLYNKSRSEWCLMPSGTRMRPDNRLGTVVTKNGEKLYLDEKVSADYFKDCHIEVGGAYEDGDFVTIQICYVWDSVDGNKNIYEGNPVKLTVVKNNKEVVKKYNRISDVYRDIRGFCGDEKCKFDTLWPKKNSDDNFDGEIWSFSKDSVTNEAISEKIKNLYNVALKVVNFIYGTKGKEALTTKNVLPEKGEFTLEEMEKILSAIEGSYGKEEFELFKEKYEYICKRAYNYRDFFNRIEVPNKPKCKEKWECSISEVPKYLVDYYNELYKAKFGKEPDKKFEISACDTTRGMDGKLDWLEDTLKKFEEYIEESDFEKAKHNWNKDIQEKNETLRLLLLSYIKNVPEKSMFKDIEKPSLEGDLTTRMYVKKCITDLFNYFDSLHKKLNNNKVALSRNLENGFKNLKELHNEFKEINDKNFLYSEKEAYTIGSCYKILPCINRELENVYEPEQLKADTTVPKNSIAGAAPQQSSVLKKVVKSKKTRLAPPPLSSQKQGVQNKKARPAPPLPISSPKQGQQTNINWVKQEDFNRCLDESKVKDVEDFINRYKSLISVVKNDPLIVVLDDNITDIQSLETNMKAAIVELIKKTKDDEKSKEYIDNFNKDMQSLNEEMKKLISDTVKDNRWKTIKGILNNQLSTLERLLVRATKTDTYSKEVDSEEEKLNDRGLIKRTAGRVAKFVEDSWNSITNKPLKPVKLTLDNTMVTNFENMANSIKNWSLEEKNTDLKTSFKTVFSGRKNTYESWYNYVYSIVCDIDKCINHKNKDKENEIKSAVQISLMYVFVRSMLHCDLKNVNSIREGIKNFVLTIDKDISSKKDVSEVEKSQQTSKEVMQAGTKTRQLCKDVKSNMMEVLERKKSLRKDVLKKEQCKKILGYLPNSYKSKLMSRIVK